MKKVKEIFGYDLSLDYRHLSVNQLEEMGFKMDCESTDTDTPITSLDFYLTLDDIEDKKMMITIGYTQEEWDLFMDDEGIFYDPDINNKEGYCRFI